MILNDLSDKEIERGLWYLKNKGKIKKISIFFLIILIFILYGYSIVKFTIMEINDYKDKDQVWASVNFSSVPKQKPNDLNFLTKDIVASGLNTYDLVLSVQNPNQMFAVYNITYRFKYGDKFSNDSSDFILPGQTKRLIIKDLYSENIINDFDVEITNISWKKIKSTDSFPTTNDFYLIENSILDSSDDDISNRSWVQFDVINDSPYNFAESNFYVLVYVGTKLIAVDEINVNNFYSRDRKHLESGWSYVIPSYSNFVIESDTNIFDQNNYISNK